MSRKKLEVLLKLIENKYIFTLVKKKISTNIEKKKSNCNIMYISII